MTAFQSNQLINIHHLFLPAFVGGKPYHQAHDRGVKLIGATVSVVNMVLFQRHLSIKDMFEVQGLKNCNARYLSLFVQWLSNKKRWRFLCLVYDLLIGDIYHC